jgi:hypothetical protein
MSKPTLAAFHYQGELLHYKIKFEWVLEVKLKLHTLSDLFLAELLSPLPTHTYGFMRSSLRCRPVTYGVL